jgi:hypothetical protein
LTGGFGSLGRPGRLTAAYFVTAVTLLPRGIGACEAPLPPEAIPAKIGFKTPPGRQFCIFYNNRSKNKMSKKNYFVMKSEKIKFLWPEI